MPFFTKQKNLYIKTNHTSHVNSGQDFLDIQVYTSYTPTLKKELLINTINEKSFGAGTIKPTEEKTTKGYFLKYLTLFYNFRKRGFVQIKVK
jgi:hypothetical protein